MSLRDRLRHAVATSFAVVFQPVASLKYATTCDECQGTGQVFVSYPDDLFVFDELESFTCGECGGSGWRHDAVIKRYLKCDSCGGDGTIINDLVHPPEEATCSGCKGSGWRWRYLATHYRRCFRAWREDNYEYYPNGR